MADENAPIGLTYAEVVNLNPCSTNAARVTSLLGGKEQWDHKSITATQARAAGCTLDDLIWVAVALAESNPKIKKRVSLWLADLAARVLHIYEIAYMSKAPRAAIIAARQYERGEIDIVALNAVRAAAWTVALGAGRAAPMHAARAAAGASGRILASEDAARHAARHAAEAAARHAAEAAARHAAEAVARHAEQTWQFDRLIEWLSDPIPEDWPLG